MNSYKLASKSYVRKPVDFSAWPETIGQVELYWLTLTEPVPVQP